MRYYCLHLTKTYNLSATGYHESRLKTTVFRVLGTVFENRQNASHAECTKSITLATPIASKRQCHYTKNMNSFDLLPLSRSLNYPISFAFCLGNTCNRTNKNINSHSTTQFCATITRPVNAPHTYTEKGDLNSSPC